MGDVCHARPGEKLDHSLFLVQTNLDTEPLLLAVIHYVS
jgi:hypothetical protein